MAGITVLKIEDLHLVETQFKRPFEMEFEHKLKSYIRRFGQFFIPIVCEVNGVVRFVDGLGFTKVYQSLGFEELCVNNIGTATEREFFSFRLFYNIRKNEVDHIKIAEEIGRICSNKIDYKNLSMKTNLSEKDIERYAKLLEFDWEEFARLPLNVTEDQFKMFEDDIF